MQSNGHLTVELLDLKDELTLGLTHIDNLLALAMEAEDSSTLSTLHTCMQEYVDKLRTLLRSQGEPS